MSNEKNGAVLKVSLGFISTLIMVILGFSISASNSAVSKANKNMLDISKMEVEQKYTREAIQEMKDTLREILKELKQVIAR